MLINTRTHVVARDIFNRASTNGRFRNQRVRVALLDRVYRISLIETRSMRCYGASRQQFFELFAPETALRADRRPIDARSAVSRCLREEFSFMSRAKPEKRAVRCGARTFYATN